MNLIPCAAVCNGGAIVCKLKRCEQVARLTDCRLQGEAGPPYLTERGAVAGGVENTRSFAELNAGRLTQAQKLTVGVKLFYAEVTADLIKEDVA